MAVLSFTDAEVLGGPYRLTGRTNAVDFELTSTALDVTNFDSDGWTELIGGLSRMAASVDGHYDAAALETGALTLDEQLFSELAGSQLPLTIAPTKADGSTAYVTGTKRGSLSMFGQIGDVAPFQSDMWGDGLVGRGALLHPANTTETVSGNGTGRQLGAVASGQSLLIGIHVTALSGTSPTIDLTVESDDNSGFTTAATVHNTGSISTPTGTLVTVAGPVTDDWFRVTWTITGTSPVIRFAVSAGLSPTP